MKLLIFGIGDYYNRYKKWLAQHEILALLDNSAQKQYTTIDGLPVLPPSEGICLPYDIIIILSFYVEQMKKQLVSLGVAENRIYHFYDLHELLSSEREVWPVHYYLNAEKIIESPRLAEPAILLMSQELTLGGPPIALFHAALILKKRGYKVVYASMLDGPLKDQLLKAEIPVVVDENLQVAVMKEISWVKRFSLIVCNTLNFHVFLSERDTDIPVIWWLHDARFFYDGVNKKVIGRINFENLKIASVGPVPAEAIKEFLPDIEWEELLYGVDDIGNAIAENKGGENKDKKNDNRSTENNNKENRDIENENVESESTKYGNAQILRFVTIGFLEDIKGQDILIDAVKQISDSMRKQCRFYIVGYDRTLFGETIHRECKDLREIIFTGTVSREKIHRLLEFSDVLVCPSRQDSMPTVAAEAMMHSIPCIVSDVVGTASYIHDGVEGFIFQSGNTQELADKIKWCVANSHKLRNMGKMSRKIYENYFSMSVFEDTLLDIIKKSL